MTEPTKFASYDKQSRTVTVGGYSFDPELYPKDAERLAKNINTAHDLAVKEAAEELRKERDTALSDLKKAVEALEWIVSQKKYFFAECDLAEQVIQKVEEALASLCASKEKR